MTRFLTTSDWHLDAVTAGMRRVDDLRRAVDKTVEISLAKKVDAYVFTGDLADPDCGSILVQVADIAVSAAVALSDSDIPSFWIPGNHDVIEDGSGFTTLHFLTRVHENIHVFEGPGLFKIGSLYAAFLPFPSRANLYDPDAYVREYTPDVVFGHCTGIDGVEVGSETRDMARGAELPFPLAACKDVGVKFMANGHFHKRQVTKDGIHIPGTLERLRFDEEENEPGILVVDI